MFRTLIDTLFGSASDRRVKGYQFRVDAINALEPELAKLSDNALRERTHEFRRQIANEKTLDEILIPAFATVREAAKRTLALRHFDVHLIAGMVLHEGDIAEMKSGEDKTLAATLAVYLNALAGRGVHLAAVDDYVARRDAAWMGQIYSFLGMTTGAIVHGLDDNHRRQAYGCDVTYGTNKEYGFDYLRDTMKFSLHDMVQRGHYYVIVDEVDSILIDEARTPLIISGPARRYSEGLRQALEAKEHVQVQLENQTFASMTFQNYFRMYEKLAGMTGTAATEADELFDVYKLKVVEIPTNQPVARLDEDDEVYRTQKEKYTAILAEIERANARLQPVLVGTASIDKSEVLAEYMKQHGYKQIDFSKEGTLEKLYAAARAGKPAKLFAVLNSRFHEQEAYIAAEAGLPGAITIATNMAGRGTDIKLGGSLEMRIQQETAGITDQAEKAKRIEQIKGDVERFRKIVLNAEETVEIEPAKGNKPAKTIKKPGGLYIIGSERHESRRIENLLRGLSGRQGDPGRSKFFLSLEDELMGIYDSDRLDGMLQRLDLKEGEPIIDPWIKKELDEAKLKVEARNFEIRKKLFQFDEVLNDERKVIFDQRIDLMKRENVAETIAEMRHAFIEDLVVKHVPEHTYAEQWDIARLKEELKRVLDLDLPIEEWAKEEGIAEEELLARIENRADEHMAAKVAQWGPDVMLYVEKTILLQTLDHLWRNHVVMTDRLRRESALHSTGPHDPFQDYKLKALNLFKAMPAQLREAVTAQLMRVDILPPETKISRASIREVHKAEPEQVDREPENPASLGAVRRNENCPCGSGKKYKHCHGKYM
ncbi:SEC-C metal-binding domain-containing protein [Bradyrhizobium elkanii]|uniref:preprotein translocase subunit SecA n=1 Tax=Bradyrhizobium elkanii TaxID=29448 RepID=UPI002714C075|nr:preprotein translocase subunit SecA [Bradyrhizobium elkanii]WLB09466.1 SEC-C metal-binding domain-containing protein [Bradyrhizobium elkanii]WLB72588.1 SEC-C metal-binding domain-containing protein [Bradyrhizobium elkanii]